MFRSLGFIPCMIIMSPTLRVRSNGCVMLSQKPSQVGLSLASKGMDMLPLSTVNAG